MSQPPTPATNLGRPRRPPVVVIVIILLAGVQLMTIDDSHDWGDFAMYVSHARNLASGIDYSETGYIYNPDYARLGPPSYPPVYPALLAPIYYFFGLSLRPMKALSVVAFAFFLYFVFVSFRRDLSTGSMLLLVGALALSPFFWRIQGNIASDIPFLALFFGTLLAVQRLDGNRSSPVAGGIALGTLFYLCYGTRAIGVVLLPAILVLDLLRNRKLSRQTVVAGVTFAVGFVAQALLVPGVGGYADQLRADPRVALTNMELAARDLSYVFLNGNSLTLRLMLTALVVTLALAGYWMRARRELTVYEVFPVFYVLVILVWPANQGLRFLMPLVPLLFFYALYALEHSRPLHGTATRRVATAALFLALAASYVGQYLNPGGPGETRTTGVHEIEAQELFSFVREHTEADDTFIFRKPRALALFTGRSAAAYHEARQESELWGYFADIGATYVVNAIWDDPDFQDFVERNRSRFVEVFSNSKYTVLRISQPPAL